MTVKDFSVIEDDHLFFMNAATEARQDRLAHLGELRNHFIEKRFVDWLDIGCSQGEFTSSLLREWKFPANGLSLSLLEPVRRHRQVAADALSRFTGELPREVEHLGEEPDKSFDMILANHSCYYVADAGETVDQVVRLLRPGGLAIIAIAGHDNFLVDLWRIGFRALGREIPYWVADDFQRVLSDRHLSFRSKEVGYEIQFEDTLGNRERILRFLFGEDWADLDVEFFRMAFAPFSQDGWLRIPAQSRHLVIEAPEG